jgi:hypothetical protein
MSDALQRLLLRIEAEAHSRGWDRPARLIVIGTQLQLQSWSIENTQHLAHVHIEATGRPVWTIMAVAYLAEAYALDAGSLADVKAYTATYKPGDITRNSRSVEVRNITAIDTMGTQHQVLRVRSGKPVYESMPDEEMCNKESLIGAYYRVPQSLRRILKEWTDNYGT